MKLGPIVSAINLSANISFFKIVNHFGIRLIPSNVKLLEALVHQMFMQVKKFFFMRNKVTNLPYMEEGYITLFINPL